MSENFYNGDTESGDVFGQLNPRLQRIGQDFGFFGILSILYGAFGSFCLFRNPLGITVPLFVAVTYGAAFLVFRRMGVAVKKESYFLAAVSVLIGLSALLLI